MATTTIRRNAFKRIEQILATCVLIRECYISDMSDRQGTVTAADVLKAGQEYEFDRVRLDDGALYCHIHRNWTFIGYQSWEVAKRHLTPQAFEKYRPA